LRERIGRGHQRHITELLEERARIFLHNAQPKRGIPHIIQATARPLDFRRVCDCDSAPDHWARRA
jgi:hypothetical protein